MAEEETKPEETQETTETTETTETVKTEETKAPESSDAEKKLTEQMSELQGKFDTLSQGAEKDKQLLEQITPYVDFEAVKKGQPGGESDELGGEGEQTFLTQKEAKALEQRIDTKIKTSEFQRDFRDKYPDLGDKGPKEEMVRYYFEKEKGSFDKRLESAVELARALLKSERDKGKVEVEVDVEKKVKETKAKAEAAAKASGLSSAGITSPKTSEGEEDDTAKGYVTERKAKSEKLRTGR